MGAVAPDAAASGYPSAHVTLFTAMLRMMADLVGDCHEIEFYAPGFADPLTYDSLSDLSDASIEARVNIGYHFRETCEVSQILGREIADHILENFLERRGHRGSRHCFGRLPAHH